jgi:hypothetical protein
MGHPLAEDPPSIRRGSPRRARPWVSLPSTLGQILPDRGSIHPRRGVSPPTRGTSPFQARGQVLRAHRPGDARGCPIALRPGLGSIAAWARSMSRENLILPREGLGPRRPLGAVMLPEDPFMVTKGSLSWRGGLGSSRAWARSSRRRLRSVRAEALHPCAPEHSAPQQRPRVCRRRQDPIRRKGPRSVAEGVGPFTTRPRVIDR